MKSGDVVLGLGAIALIAALAYPTLRDRAFDSRVDRALADIETLSTGARGVHGRTGEWPPDGSIGELPVQLIGYFPEDSTLARASYALQWATWEFVDQVVAAVQPADSADGDDAPPDSVAPVTVPVVRTVGAVIVHSGEDALLAALLAHHGSEAFVRDTLFTLVVPEVPRP